MVILISANLLTGLSSMKMPPSMRKRGRPKGAELTVIDLPKRRKKDKPVKFLTKLPVEREHGTVNYLQSVVCQASKDLLYSF